MTRGVLKVDYEESYFRASLRGSQKTDIIERLSTVGLMLAGSSKYIKKLPPLGEGVLRH